MSSLKCIIIDDEPVARNGIEEYVNETALLTLTGKFSNPVKSFPLIAQNQVDLIFLDIEMPKINGIEFIRNLKEPPMIIIITAYPEHAIEGYSLNVLDYLLKPVSLERFMRAVKKASEFNFLKQKSVSAENVRYDNFIFIKCDNRYEKILFNEIIYIEAMQNYIRIHTLKNSFITYLTFRKIEETLPPVMFIRVHKSYIINLEHVTCLEGNVITVKESKIPLSRELKPEIMERIFGNKLIRR